MASNLADAMECDVGDITVNYESLGEGRPIVMLHGLSLDHTVTMFEMERHFARRLGWMRIYPDLPGMGRTPAADWIRSNDDTLQGVERALVSEWLDRVEAWTLADAYSRRRGVEASTIGVRDGRLPRRALT